MFKGGLEGKRLIYGAVLAFLVTCALLFIIGGRLAPKTTAGEPGFAVDETARPSPDGTFQVTLDASHHKRWIPFDLAAGTVRGGDPEDPASDLIVRRYLFRAPHGAVALGKVPLAEARVPAGAVWVRDALKGGEVQNAALARWYSYSYWTHLLRSLGETYAVRLAGGGIAYLEIKGYNCKPDAAGCLTMRYRLDLESAGSTKK